MTITMSISPGGVILYLHTDALDLSSLGRVRIKRASHVEFSNRLQLWTVRWPGKRKPAYYAGSRQECLDWERQQLEERL
jgi:hypothetical protein